MPALSSAQAVPIAVKIRIHIVDVLSFAYGDINIIALNAEHSDIPRWRHSRQANICNALIFTFWNILVKEYLCNREIL